MSLDIFKAFATDETRENNGTWVPLGGGAKLLVARSGNPKYAKRLSSEFEEHRLLLEQEGAQADAKSVEIMVDVMAESVLLGWEGLSFKGEDMPYSLENAKKLLAVKDFRRKVTEISQNLSNYLIKQEQDQGNA